VQALAGSAAALVSVSTDYVFDGAQRRPYIEADTPQPLSVYARTKLEGERVALRHPAAVVVRPSTLFGPARMNFCDAVVEACRTRRPIQVFEDQTTSPTYTADCAEAIAALIEAAAWRRAGSLRIYHVANEGACARLAFARRIIELTGGEAALLQPVRMAETKRPAPRPAYSALATTELPQVIGRRLRPWDEALRAYLQGRRSLSWASG